MAGRVRSEKQIRSSEPREVRKRQIAVIMGCFEEPRVGKYFLKYVAKSGRKAYFAKLLRLSDKELCKECELADLLVTFLLMGLLVKEGFLDPEEMSPEALVEYRTYCKDIAECLRRVDLNQPPEFLKLYSGISLTERKEDETEGI